MTLKLSVEVRNSLLDDIESEIGTAPILRIYTGSAPTNTTDAATGTLLAEMTLPSDWMAAASTGTKAKSGTWEDASANASGVAGYFRIYNSGDTICHIQGTAGESTDSPDLVLDNKDINATQSVTVSTFTLTGPNS